MEENTRKEMAEGKHQSAHSDLAQEGPKLMANRAIKILVRNVPKVATEEDLEIFFENRRKSGGGPVRKVKIDEKDQLAIVQFEDDDGSVFRRIKEKCPLRLMRHELEIEEHISPETSDTELEDRGTALQEEDFTDSIQLYVDHTSQRSMRLSSADAAKIMSYLNAKSLCAAELVCKDWRRLISMGMLWKLLMEKMVKTDNVWRGLAKRQGWRQYLFKSNDDIASKDSIFYKKLYSQVLRDSERLRCNWQSGRYITQRIVCSKYTGGVKKAVYCLQYDDKKIVCGLRDNTIQIWDRSNLKCAKILKGHTESVLSLQFNDDVIISSSSDCTVRVWNVNTGEVLNVLIQHNKPVLHVRFTEHMIVSSSKDRSVAVWDMLSYTNISLRRVLIDHKGAVNVVECDEKYIVSGSGDRTIKVWTSADGELVRTLSGHKKGVACLQYNGKLVISGSSDETLRLWDIESGECLRMLEGHGALVRCLLFDTKRIVTGAYDGYIKIWDLTAALEPVTSADIICRKTVLGHSGKVLHLQFDDFQIISCSSDGTILVMDFLNVEDKGRTKNKNKNITKTKLSEPDELETVSASSAADDVRGNVQACQGNKNKNIQKVV